MLEFIIPVVGGTIVSIFLIRSAFNAGGNKVLNKLAEKYNLNFSANGTAPDGVGVYKGRWLMFKLEKAYPYATINSPRSELTNLIIRVGIHSDLHEKTRICKKGPLEKSNSSITGNKKFDKKVIVQTESPDETLNYLNEARQDVILTQMDKYTILFGKVENMDKHLFKQITNKGGFKFFDKQLTYLIDLAEKIDAA